MEFVRKFNPISCNTINLYTVPEEFQETHVFIVRISIVNDGWDVKEGRMKSGTHVNEGFVCVARYGEEFNILREKDEKSTFLKGEPGLEFSWCS